MRTRATRARTSTGQWTATPRDLEVDVPSVVDQEKPTTYAQVESLVAYRPPEPRVIRRPDRSRSHPLSNMLMLLSRFEVRRTSTFLQMVIVLFGILARALKYAVFLTALALTKSVFFWEQSSNLINVGVAWFNNTYEPGSLHAALFPESSTSASYQVRFSILPAAGEYALLEFGVPVLFNNPVVWLAILVALWVSYAIVFAIRRCLEEAKEVVVSHQAVDQTST